MKNTISFAKTMVTGVDNMYPPADIADLEEDASVTATFRCFRDLALFEYCVNPLKTLTLKEYE